MNIYIVYELKRPGPRHLLCFTHSAQRAVEDDEEILTSVSSEDESYWCKDCLEDDKPKSSILAQLKKGVRK